MQNTHRYVFSVTSAVVLSLKSLNSCQSKYYNLYLTACLKPLNVEILVSFNIIRHRVHLVLIVQQIISILLLMLLTYTNYDVFYLLVTKYNIINNNNET